MKIYKEKEFQPIILRIETEAEARYLLAVFNRAPSVMADTLERQFTEEELMDITGRTNNKYGKSAWEQLNNAMGNEGQ